MFSKPFFHNVVKQENIQKWHKCVYFVTCATASVFLSFSSQVTVISWMSFSDSSSRSFSSGAFIDWKRQQLHYNMFIIDTEFAFFYLFVGNAFIFIRRQNELVNQFFSFFFIYEPFYGLFYNHLHMIRVNISIDIYFSIYLKCWHFLFWNHRLKRKTTFGEKVYQKQQEKDRNN